MIFRRRSTPDAEFPQLDRAAADRFRSLVTAEVVRRHGSCTIADGVASAGETRYGLENLVRSVATLPAEQWPDRVRTHFDSITLQAPPAPLDLAAVMPRIRPADQTQPTALQRSLTDDLVSVLCLDEPERITTPTADDLLTLGPPEVVAGRAVANLRAHLATVPVDRFDAGQEARPMHCVASDSFFTASAALLPASDGWPAPGDHGLGHVVAVPTRHLLISVLLGGEPDWVETVNQLVGVAANRYDADPGPISPDLYWVHEDRWQRISRRTPDGVTITLGPELESRL